MMQLELKREKSVDGATLGRLFIGTTFICDTLEDVIREVPGKPVTEWKVHGETAIPQGTYKIILENSPRFGPQTISLPNVPGFQFIRGHAGNFAKDTEGCLLFGTRNSSCTVKNSKVALGLVKDLIKGAIASGQEVSIKITNP
jgi:hypothetical protein